VAAIVFHRCLHKTSQTGAVFVVVGPKLLVLDVELAQPAIHLSRGRVELFDVRVMSRDGFLHVSIAAPLKLPFGSLAVMCLLGAVAGWLAKAR